MTSPKLSDIQLIFLATAVQRDDGSILPPPESLGDQGARIRKAIPPLLKRALVEEIGVTDPTRVWREDGEARIGLAITDAGRLLIAVAEAGDDKPAITQPDTAIAAIAPVVKAGSKIDAVADMLRRAGGATLAELVDATGWLPHTTRAALTGLRKKGHAITKTDRDSATAYMIAAAA